MDTFFCPMCESQVPREHWRFAPKKPSHEGRAAYCKPCEKRKHREYYLANRDRWRGYNRKSRFGLTEEGFAALLTAQGGRCAICPATESGGKGWQVDHDHSCCPSYLKTCGKCIRGVLCVRCNTMLGMASDDPDRLRAALRYLEGD